MNRRHTSTVLGLALVALALLASACSPRTTTTTAAGAPTSAPVDTSSTTVDATADAQGTPKAPSVPPDGARGDDDKRSVCTPDPIGATAPAGVTCRNITVDGFTREYLLYVPAAVAADATRPVPVVLMFHGSSGTGEEFLAHSGWREKADQEGFVAAFPTGLEYFVTEDGKARWNTKWNSFTLPLDIDVSKRLPGYPAEAPWPADDVGFTDAMLDDIERLHAIDTDREYASGFSNGASFATRLAVELPDRIAAVGAGSGSLQETEPVLGHGGVPAPLWYVLGTADDHFLEHLPDVDELPLDPDALRAIPMVDGLFDTLTSEWGLPSAPCSIDRTETTTTFRWCASGRPDVHVTIVAGLVHHFPNGPDPKRNPSGLVAADLFWPFFEENPLR